MQDLQYLSTFERDIGVLNDFNKFIAYHKNEFIASSYGKRKAKRYNPMSALSDEEFCKKYHFTKENMSKIIEMMGDDLDIDSASNGHKQNQVAGDMQVMIALRAWALTEHPEITAAVHGISYETLRKICKRVASAFAIKASRFIRMPATLSEKEQVTSSFRALAAMPQIIGTVIHKTVRVLDAPLENTMDNTKGYIYIQLISDASLKIRDIDCKFQKKLNEHNFSRMFTKSRIRERMEQNEFRGRYLLGNAQINNSNVLLTPLVLARTDKEIAYNAAHKTTYRPAINCMQLLSSRFGIVESDLCGSLNTARNTIITLALLHNLGIEWADTSIKLTSKMYCTMPLSNHMFEYTKDAAVQNKIFQQDFIRNNF